MQVGGQRRLPGRVQRQEGLVHRAVPGAEHLDEVGRRAVAEDEAARRCTAMPRAPPPNSLLDPGPRVPQSAGDCTPAGGGTCLPERPEELADEALRRPVRQADPPARAADPQQLGAPPSPGPARTSRRRSRRTTSKLPSAKGRRSASAIWKSIVEPFGLGPGPAARQQRRRHSRSRSPRTSGGRRRASRCRCRRRRRARARPARRSIASAERLADDLQRGADDGIVAGRPGGVLPGLDGGVVGRGCVGGHGVMMAGVSLRGPAVAVPARRIPGIARPAAPRLGTARDLP